MVSGGGGGGHASAAADRRLFRTDSVDSTSSLGSLILGEDVCRCDDCLLGIGDLYTIGPAESAMARKKVNLKFVIFRSDDQSPPLCFTFLSTNITQVNDYEDLSLRIAPILVNLN